MRYRVKGLLYVVVSLILLLMGFREIPLITITLAQAPQFTLTTTSVLPRFADSPTETDDYFAEILELQSDDPQATEIRLAFWGADAVAYPNIVRSPRWLGNRLAMVFVDRDGRETIAVWNVDDSELSYPLAEGTTFTQISPPEWSLDGEQLLFSGIDTLGREQVLQLSLANNETKRITDGRLPVYSPDNSQIAYLNPDNKVAILTPSNNETHLYEPLYSQATSLAWSPDGAFLAVTEGAYVVTIDMETGRNLRIFDAYYQLELPTTATIETRSAAWSPDGGTLVMILNTTEMSQVIAINHSTLSLMVVAERHYTETLDDPRRFIDVTFQPRGAFLPSRENRSDL